MRCRDAVLPALQRRGGGGRERACPYACVCVCVCEKEQRRKGEVQGGQEERWGQADTIKHNKISA